MKTKTLLLIANALNNFGTALVFFPRESIERYPTIVESIGADRVRAIEDASPKMMKAALLAYKINTDWSAFSRIEWADAVCEVDALLS